MEKYYHCAGRRGPYFEGWYLKNQAPSGRVLSLIPAVHMDRQGRRSASLQVITEQDAWWLEYPGRDLRASDDVFQISLGGNAFSWKGIQINVEQDGLSLCGSLSFGRFTPLKTDIMGPFCYLPGMECRHGVVSMGHTLTGTLTVNGRLIDFTRGTGYIETDRGRSFPQAYLWTQCMWREGQSIMLSIATIPVSAFRFTGCICAVCCGGREYRLATYCGARVEQWSEQGALLRQGKYRLAVERLSGEGRPLRAPVHGAMDRTIRESLAAVVRFRFWEGGKLLLDHVDRYASFEYAGENSVEKRGGIN